MKLIILKLEFIMMTLLVVSTKNVFAVIASLCIIIYYLSILKVNVVDEKHSGSWRLYWKSWRESLLRKKKK